jgi:hypothetical protein
MSLFNPKPGHARQKVARVLATVKGINRLNDNSLSRRLFDEFLLPEAPNLQLLDLTCAEALSEMRLSIMMAAG